MNSYYLPKRTECLNLVTKKWHFCDIRIYTLFSCGSGFKRLTDELPHYTDYSQGLRPVARCTVRSATRKTVAARVVEPLKLVLLYNLNSPGLHIHF
jgi:hypothetical protein